VGFRPGAPCEPGDKEEVSERVPLPGMLPPERITKTSVPSNVSAWYMLATPLHARAVFSLEVRQLAHGVNYGLAIGFDVRGG